MAAKKMRAKIPIMESTVAPSNAVIPLSNSLPLDVVETDAIKANKATVPMEINSLFLDDKFISSIWLSMKNRKKTNHAQMNKDQNIFLLNSYIEEPVTTKLFFGARSESNDRAKRLFGYKIDLTANRRSLLP